MTGHQFLLAALDVFPELEPAEVAECFEARHLPPLADIQRAAEVAQNVITPSEWTVHRHARLQLLIDWAEESQNLTT